MTGAANHLGHGGTQLWLANGLHLQVEAVEVVDHRLMAASAKIQLQSIFGIAIL